MIRDAETEFNLPPGFRFHPTDEELIVHYLCRKAAHQPLPAPIIAEVDLYKFDPWQLPGKALSGQREWYFFTPRDRKYPGGSRPNRAAASGYWKATGVDKPIPPSGRPPPLGIKKSLVFYSGKSPFGVKTDWIMHEYRLTACSSRATKKKDGSSLRLDDWVLCRLYHKKNTWGQAQRSQADVESAGESMQDALSGDRTKVADVDNDLRADEGHQCNPFVVATIAPPMATESAYATRENASVGNREQYSGWIKEGGDNSWFRYLNLGRKDSSSVAPMDLMHLMDQDHLVALAAQQQRPSHDRPPPF